LLSQNGANISLARRIGAQKDSAHAVPGRDVVCVVDGDRSECTPNEYLGRSFSVGICSGLPTGVISIAGMVPDDVSNVAVLLKDGSTTPVVVHRNYLDIEVRVPPVAIRWRAADGGVVNTPVPPVEPATCQQ